MAKVNISKSEAQKVISEWSTGAKMGVAKAVIAKLQSVMNNPDSSKEVSLSSAEQEKLNWFKTHKMGSLKGAKMDSKSTILDALNKVHDSIPTVSMDSSKYKVLYTDKDGKNKTVELRATNPSMAEKYAKADTALNLDKVNRIIAMDAENNREKLNSIVSSAEDGLISDLLQAATNWTNKQAGDNATMDEIKVSYGHKNEYKVFSGEVGKKFYEGKSKSDAIVAFKKAQKDYPGKKINITENDGFGAKYIKVVKDAEDPRLKAARSNPARKYEFLGKTVYVLSMTPNLVVYAGEDGKIGNTGRKYWNEEAKKI